MGKNLNYDFYSGSFALNIASTVNDLQYNRMKFRSKKIIYQMLTTFDKKVSLVLSFKTYVI